MKDEVKNWLKKIEDVKKGNADLSVSEDLSIALMNLVSLEEHFYFTAIKTDNQKYFEMMQSVRKLRGDLLKKIVKNPVGEEWCISKHLLAASMRLIEVGTKEQTNKNTKEAHMYFEKAFELYSLFFAINLKMIDTQKLEKNLEFEKTDGMMKKFSGAVKNLLDCCKEW